MKEEDKTVGYVGESMLDHASEDSGGTICRTGQDDRFADGEKNNAACTELQRDVAVRAHAIITENPERHITVRELSQMLHVSATQIKVCFRKVYGMPVYTYTRSMRMDIAAGLLADTDESILEIAGKCGYENGSKFARAFKSVKGISPGKYRRQIRWERENQAVGQEAL